MASRKKLLRYSTGAFACVFVLIAILIYQDEHSRQMTWISPAEAQARMKAKSGLEKTADFVFRRLPSVHRWMIGKLRKPLLIEAWTFKTSNLERAFKLNAVQTTNDVGMRGWVLSAKDFEALTYALSTNSDLKNTSSCVYTASGVPGSTPYPSFVVAGIVATNSGGGIQPRKFDYIVCDLNSLVRFDSVKFDSTIQRTQGTGFKNLAGIEVSLRRGEALLVDTNQRLNGGENCWYAFVWKKN